MKKINFIAISVILALVILIQTSALVSAEFWACFNKGQKTDFCNPATPDRICKTTLCRFCMSNYNDDNKCYNQGAFNVCNSIHGSYCNFFGPNATPDDTPPIMTINSPLNNSLHTAKGVLIDFEIDELANVYYLDLINGKGKWTRVCSDCFLYSKTRNFKEGQNMIRFKATDLMGNEAFVEKNFFIDSKKPKIKKTEPKKGFASGVFSMEFQEQNPSELFLNYGNSEKGFKNKKINTSSECYENKGKSSCSAMVNLSAYNNAGIEYWFNLTDIAGNLAESKKLSLNVDTTSPIVNSINTTLNGKKVNFKISITEDNFESAEYIDNSASDPKWRAMCSKLKDGICEKSITFTKGAHNIGIQVSDKAGNLVSGGPVELNII